MEAHCTEQLTKYQWVVNSYHVAIKHDNNTTLWKIKAVLTTSLPQNNDLRQALDNKYEPHVIVKALPGLSCANQQGCVEGRELLSTTTTIPLP